MPSLLKNIAVGQCGKELFINQAGTMGSFSVGTSYIEIEKGERKIKSIWVKIKVFGQQIQYVRDNFKVGAMVYAEGDTRLETWTNPQGVEKTSLVLHFARVTFLSKKEEIKKNDDFIDDVIPF